MPIDLLMMYTGPAIVREYAGPIIRGIILASYIGGLGNEKIPITHGDDLSSRPALLTIQVASVEM